MKFLSICFVLILSSLSAHPHKPIWELDKALIWKKSILLSSCIDKCLELSENISSSDYSKMNELKVILNIMKITIGDQPMVKNEKAGLWDCLGLTDTQIRLTYDDDYDNWIGHIPYDAAPADPNPEGPGVHVS